MRYSASTSQQAQMPAGRLGLTAACLSLFSLLTWCAGSVQAQDGAQPDRQKIVSNGIEYLISQQAADGSWNAQIGPAITAMATTALLRNGRTPRDPAVAKGLAFIAQFVQPDGGIYKPGSRLQNYETCASLMCFAEANADGKYDDIIANAANQLRVLADMARDSARHKQAACEGWAQARALQNYTGYMASTPQWQQQQMHPHSPNGYHAM